MCGACRRVHWRGFRCSPTQFLTALKNNAFESCDCQNSFILGLKCKDPTLHEYWVGLLRACSLSECLYPRVRLWILSFSDYTWSSNFNKPTYKLFVMNFTFFTSQGYTSFRRCGYFFLRLCIQQMFVSRCQTSMLRGRRSVSEKGDHEFSRGGFIKHLHLL